MVKVVLRTALSVFEDMHERTERSRGKKVVVSPSTLLNLLMDHSLMVGKLKDAGHEVVDELDEDPVPVRVRKRGG